MFELMPKDFDQNLLFFPAQISRFKSKIDSFNTFVAELDYNYCSYVL